MSKPMLSLSDLVVASFETESAGSWSRHVTDTNEQTPDTSCFDCPVGVPSNDGACV